MSADAAAPPQHALVPASEARPPPAPPPDPLQVLLAATRQGNVPLVNMLLEQLRLPASASIRFPHDPDAHPLLHWAALEGHADMVANLCEKQAKPDARNGRGETALHWACIKGNAKCVQLLCDQYSADLFAADVKGYMAMHFAAQNGQTLILAMLHRRGLPINVRDNDGRTPLLWAAYKNHAFSVRWLLAHGADPYAVDWENCQAVHWAAMRGHVEVIKLLVEVGGCGPSLLAKEKTGGTPLTLATEKVARLTASGVTVDAASQHMVHQLNRVAAYCSMRIKVEEELATRGGQPSLLQRVQHKMPHWSWFLWPIMAPIGFYQYAVCVAPATSHLIQAHFCFVVCFFATWYFWTRLQVSDPGDFVVPHPGPPRRGVGVGGPSMGWRRGGWLTFAPYQVTSTVDERATAVTSEPSLKQHAQAHRDMYDLVLDKALDIPVCLTCEIVKPARAKHDRESDVCVIKFDHFCPFFNAVVGELNYPFFIGTAVCATISMWLWLYLVVIYTYSVDPSHGFWFNASTMWRWSLFAWSYSLIALYGSAMSAQHLHLMYVNLSTNEMINGYRYRYLTEDGTRGNPFNNGLVSNFAEAFGLVKPRRLSPQDYYSEELTGATQRHAPRPPPGSPWFRKNVVTDGHVMGGPQDSEVHDGHHGHSHAGGEGGGGGGHSHSGGGGHSHGV